MMPGRGYPLDTPISKIKIWDIPLLKDGDYDIMYLCFMISRQIIILGISRHKTRYLWDIFINQDYSCKMCCSTIDNTSESGRVHSLELKIYRAGLDDRGLPQIQVSS